MADLNDLIEAEGPKLSRRNVVVGTAWAVPTIMAVGAAPAMAASLYVSGTATVAPTNSKLNLTVVVSGFRTGDKVVISGVTRATGSWSWSSGPNLNVNNDFSSNSITIEVGNLKDKKATPAVAGTVNFTVTINGTQVSKSAGFSW